MSYTEIYAFNNKGDAEEIGNTKNAFRGAMSVWLALEKKYLPSLPVPSWAKMMGDIKDYYSRTSPSFIEEDTMKDIWELPNDNRMTDEEKVVLMTTFDNVVVPRENIKDVIECFRAMKFESSLNDQADVLEKYADNENYIAFAWNQTSVNADTWQSSRMAEDEDGDEYYLPYNLNIESDHWYLFNQKESVGA